MRKVFLLKMAALALMLAIVLLPAACNNGQHEDPPEEVIPVTGITFNHPATLSLIVGETLTLESSVEPAEATNQTVTWSSSDDCVATVNAAGEITAVAPGTATITASADDGKFTATCTVTVEAQSITMTTQATEVLIRIGVPLETDLIIDWGDGAVSNINDGSDKYVDDGGLSLSFYHNCSGVSAHKITITGEIYSLVCNNSQLTTLNVIGATALTYLECCGNQLTELDVSNNRALTHLQCGGNQLTELDVSRNIVLREFYCDDSQLTELDVSSNTELIYLSCTDNQLTKLDMSCNTELTFLHCSKNQLKQLDMSRNIKLVTLNCYNNQLTTSALNDLFRSLPNLISYTKNLSMIGALFVLGNPGADNCNVSIATEKGWRVNPTAYSRP